MLTAIFDLAFSVVGLIIWLIVALILAVQFHQVAADKGYPQMKYFWLTFLFGVLGYMLVIALPDRGSVDKGNTERDVTPAIADSDDEEALPDL